MQLLQRSEIIKLKLINMEQKSIDKIIEMYDRDEDFTCRDCKEVIKSEDCEGCPIYGQGFCSD